jgi:hypothetical protein
MKTAAERRPKSNQRKPPKPKPYAGPDWRIHRVLTMIAANAEPEESDYEWVVRAYRCLTKLNKHRWPASDADVWEATIYSARSRLDRILVDARLLAGESAAVIAARHGSTAKCLTAYEALYFDTTAHRTDEEWMEEYVLDEEEDWLCRALLYIAFKGGEGALEPVLKKLGVYWN